MKMAGADRAMLYALAIGTGLRREELRALTPESFRLDADPPTVSVPARNTKNRKVAVQPLAGWLVERLRPWIARKPSGRSVFDKMTKRTSDMLKIDLESAVISAETSEGTIDFHSLRTTYVSHLVSSGASVKTCQILARHSTPVLTLDIYAKVDRGELARAVECFHPCRRPPIT